MISRIEQRARGLAQHNCPFCFERGVENYRIQGELIPHPCRCLTRQPPLAEQKFAPKMRMQQFVHELYGKIYGRGD